MDRIFEKKFMFLILVFCLPLIFFPKINLLGFEKQTAGIRIDDLILFFLGIIFLWAFAVKSKRILPIEKWMLLIVFFSIVSFFLNQLFVSLGYFKAKANLFYSIRLMEYFLFFYIGCLASQFINLRKMVVVFLLFNATLMIFQKFGLIGKMTELGSQLIDTHRVCGICSFPSEMGALFSMLYCYLLYSESKPGSYINEFKNFFLFLFVLVFVVLTGARIALLGVFLAFIFDQFRVREKSAFHVFFLIGIGLLFIAPFSYILILKSDSIFSRSMDLFSLNNLHIIQSVWDKIDIHSVTLDNIILKEGDYDMSWWERLQKWCFALKLYVNHPECYLQGIGPGFCSSALDGSFVRILAENGLIGAFLYFKFFQSIYQKSIGLKWMFFAFLLNMIFFDVYLAYKPMSFLLLAMGYTYGMEMKKNPAVCY